MHNFPGRMINEDLSIWRLVDDYSNSDKSSQSFTSTGVLAAVVSQDKVFSGYLDIYGENSPALPGLKYLTCYAPVSGACRKNKLELTRH